MFISVINDITGPIANVGPVAALEAAKEAIMVLLNGMDGIPFDMDIRVRIESETFWKFF